MLNYLCPFKIPQKNQVTREKTHITEWTKNTKIKTAKENYNLEFLLHGQK